MPPHLAYAFLIYVLGIELKFSCLQGKYLSGPKEAPFPQTLVVRQKPGIPRELVKSVPLY